MASAPFPAVQPPHGAAPARPGQGNAAPATSARAPATISPDAFVTTGNALLARNQSAVAMVCFQKALAIAPGHAGAHNGIGLALQQLGRAQEALPHHQRAVTIRPDMAEAHASLGNAHRVLGNLEDAVGHYRNALSLRPQYTAVHNDVAGVLQMLGRTDDAIAHYGKALAARPDDPNAHYNVANLLSAAGRHDQALFHYAKAIAARPGFAEAHNNMANALQKLGRRDEAVSSYKVAVAVRPGYDEAWHNLGKTCFALDRPEEAIAAFRQALAIDGAKAMVHNDLGAACLVLGRLREAYAAFAAAVALAPRNAVIHLSLARLARFKPDDPRLAALEKLAEFAPSLDENDVTALNFALGKAHADLGNSERSFGHLLRANALKRHQVGYDEAQALGEFERARTVFTPKLMRRNGGHGDHSQVPVFIVGMPRSGSTLLEQILASHSRVFGAGEIDDFAAAAREVCGSEAFFERAAALGADDLRRLGGRYLERVGARAPDAARIVDKMLANVSNVGLIHLALPNARIIHARRDPVDTCLSCFSIWFGNDDLPFSYDLAELGRYYRAYAELMRHWQQALPAGVMLEVRYEDVVDDLEGQARRLLDHCGLPWEDRCLDFHLTERHVHTASVSQVRRPLYREAVGRSRAYGDLLRPLTDALESDDRGRRPSFEQSLSQLAPSRHAR